MKSIEPTSHDSQWKALFQEAHAQETSIDLADSIMQEIDATLVLDPIPKTQIRKQLRMAWGSFAASMVGLLATVLSSSLWWPVVSEGLSTYLTESVSISLVSVAVLGLGIALFWQLEPLMAYYADQRRMSWQGR